MPITVLRKPPQRRRTSQEEKVLRGVLRRAAWRIADRVAGLLLKLLALAVLGILLLSAAGGGLFL